MGHNWGGVIIGGGGGSTGSGGSGTVTSVALTAPAFLSVSGSPVTASGTIDLALAVQSANRGFFGPTTGAAAAPTFRLLVSDDIPSLAWSKITSGTPTTLSGYGITDAVKLQAATPGTPQTGHINVSGTVIAGGFSGPLTGNVTGDVSGSSGSCTGNAATATTATTAGAVTTIVAGKVYGRGSAGGDGNGQDITLGTNLSMSGTTLNATGGGVTNSGGVNVLTKGDGSNLVASGLTDDGSTVTSSEDVTIGSAAAGKNLTVTATRGAEQMPALTTGNWTLGAGWAYATSPDRLDKNAAGTGTATPTAATTIVAGTVYQVIITVDSISGSTATYTVGGVAGTALTAATTYTDYLTATTTGNLIITPVNTALRMTISAISVKPITITTGTLTVGGTTTLRGPMSGHIPASLTLVPQTTATTPLTLRAITGGSANLFEVKGTDGTTRSWLSADGLSLTVYSGLVSTAGAITATAGSFFLSAYGQGIRWGSPNQSLVMASAGVVEWGLASATPVAFSHRLSAPSRAGIDTNTKGSNATLLPGLGTGTAGSGDFRLQTAPGGASGTTADTPADRIVLASKQVTLTESSATPVMDVSIASGTIVGGTLKYTIRADDATDFQAIRGSVRFVAVNKGGTITAVIDTPGEAVAVSSGTLTNTVTVTTGASLITLNLNAVSSLTQTTLYAYVSMDLDGQSVATTK